MSSPNSEIRNRGAREFLTTALLGLFLMMILTIWWWSAMR
jgi:hypothetical protein